MLSPSERGCLLLADISGYTGYLADSELDHAQNVLADLVETVVRGLRPMFKLAKLEGDAAFAYAATAQVDGSMLLDTIEKCYFGFRRRLDGIVRATTCPCNACRQIPGLNLKFFVHHGEFARHKVAGREELTGTDVIRVHRLLKNSVAETLGLRGYALMSAACVATAGLDPATLGMREHRETYEHIGEIVGFVHDLEARWRDEQSRRRVYVSPSEADPELLFHLPAEPEVVWDYLTSPKRWQWMPGLTGFDQVTAGGRRGAGTVNHCAHGDTVVVEEILDWRPFTYVTLKSTMPGVGEIVETMEFEPEEGGTRLAWRRRRERGRKARQAWAMAAAPTLQFFQASMARLSQVLAEAGESAAGHRPHDAAPVAGHEDHAGEPG
jgi:uncharacterized protein YndB with AHSA1/START domain